MNATADSSKKNGIAMSGKAADMDQTDQHIIDVLHQDGRMSYRKVAEHIGKTEATVRRRVKKMQKRGVVDHFTVILSEEYDKPIKAIVTITPDLTARKRVADILVNMDEVTDVSLLSGKCGIWTRIEVSDMQEVRELIDTKLSKIEGIQNIETCFVMKELKSKYHDL